MKLFLPAFVALVITSLSAFAQQALTAGAQGQIAALRAEKAGRSPAQLKMDSQLVHMMKKARGERIGANVAALEAGIKVPADGMVLVDFKCVVTDALVAQLVAAGARIISKVPRFDAIRARVPLSALEVMAVMPGVRSIRAASQAITHAGPLTSQGDAAHRSAAARATFSAAGQGIKIGVLSDSVDFLAASQATGELGPVTVLPGQGGSGSGEGTAMLEIIHDLAPSAELFFATAFISAESFAQNILDLREAGCDIIVDDVGYFDEGPFQDGIIAQAVAEVVADGALYFSSAGNEGNKNDNTSGTWEGDFADGGVAAAPLPAGGRVHSFGANAFNIVNSVGFAYGLYWADALGHSANDYDLYVLNSTGTTVVAASTNVQNGTQDAFEIVNGTSAGDRIVVYKEDAAAPRFLRLTNIRGTLSVSTTSASAGHSNVEGAFCVAAVSAGANVAFTGGAANPVETFSSDGLRRIFFQADGTPITPGNFSATGGIVRQKPDIAAADNVATSVPGFNPFRGTSAAAPHAAAVAAQLWSYNRALTPAQIRTALTATALDIEAAGVDRDSGVGIVMAFPALQATTGGAILSKQSAALTAESYAAANGAPDPGEFVTFTFTLRNDGPVATTALTATLLATGGVGNPPGPVSFGVIAPGGTAARDFQFRVDGTAGATLTATLALRDGALALGTVSHTLPIAGTLGAPQTFNNAALITVNDNAPAVPHPSVINVPAGIATIGKVRVVLRQLTHTFPGDMRVMLVSPTGQTCLLMSRAGGGTPVTNVTFTLDDAAAVVIPEPIADGGVYRPAPNGEEGLDLPGDGPVAPYGSTLSVFDGANPTGNWSLYVEDAFPVDSGAFNGGWSLEITPITAATSGAEQDVGVKIITDATTVAAGETVAMRTLVTNFGATASTGTTLTFNTPPGFIFQTGTLSQGSAVFFDGTLAIIDFGVIPSGATASLDLNFLAKTEGVSSASASVTVTGAETVTANNSTSLAFTIGQANLAAAQPVIISTIAGTGTDAATIGAGDSTYVDFSYLNNGTAGIGADFVAQYFVDGVAKGSHVQTLSLAPGHATTVLDQALGSFAPGTHTLTIVLDQLGVIGESNEADNVITRTFNVAGPNLAPVGIVVSRVAGTGIDSPSSNVGDALFVDFSLVNNGSVAAGAASVAELYLDGALVSTLNVAALAAGGNAGATDLPLGPLAAGVHTLRLVVDAGGVLAETSEADNETIKTFVVNALPTITAIAPQTINEDGTTGALAFTIGDAETDAGNLTIIATSTNPALFPALAIGGSGASRTITATPPADAHGSGTVTVTVSDGNGGTATTSFWVTVAAVNDTPSFERRIGGVIVSEDSGSHSSPEVVRMISAGPANESGQALNFIVTNNNNALFQTQPTISPSGTLSFMPAPDASGIASLSVRLMDDGGGADTSASQSITISVSTVNDRPTFFKGDDVVTNEDAGPQTIAWATTITAGASNEGAQTLAFFVSATNPLLFSVQPAISLNGSLTFTAAPDAFGTTNVSVMLKDNGGTVRGGVDTSVVVTFAITVAAFNDVPTLSTLPPLVIDEDAAVQTVALTGIGTGAANEIQPITVSATSNNPALIPNPGVSYSSPGIGGSIAFKPVADASGTATITVTVDDGQFVSNSVSRSFLVTVNAVNDAPTLGPLSDITMNEDAAMQTMSVSGIGTGAVDEIQPLVLSATSSNPALIPHPAIDYSSPSSGGELMFTPVANRNGVAMITVTVSDGQGSNGTTSRTFLATVAAVNDAPTFTKGADQSVAEDGGPQTVAGWAAALVAGPADEAVQTLTFTTTNDNAALFSAQPAVAANGALTFTPAANASGTANVSVQLRDNGGGSETSALATFAIAVRAVNDAPAFAKGADQTTRNNAGAQTVAGWATALSAGPANEGAQTFGFTVTTSNDALFAVLPAISPAGVLTFTPANIASGSATVTVVLRDDGGTTDNGVDASAAQTFVIGSDAVNDAPSFTIGADLSVVQEAGAQMIAAFAGGISAGPSDEAAQALDFIVSIDQPDLFDIAPSIDAGGALTFTPSPTGSGTATVTVRLHDDGGTANGGADTSARQTFKIAVTTFIEELGTYNGIVEPDSAALAGADKTGLLRVKIVQGGSFTGSLSLGKFNWSFKSRFDHAGAAFFGGSGTLTLLRGSLPPLTLVLHLDVSGGTDTLTGTITEAAAPFATILADRALYSDSPTALPPFRAVAADLRGKYTVIFAAQPPTLANPASTFPQGDGIATLKVNAKGVASIVGTLANGAKFSYANALSKRNAWPVWVPFQNGKGSLVGRAQFRDVPGVSDIDGADMRWFKRANSAGAYPNGWPGGIGVDLVGSRFVVTAGQSDLPGLGIKDADGNAELVLSEGGIVTPLVKALKISTRNDVKVVTTSPDAFAATIVPGTGLVKGTFVHPATGGRIPFASAILQKQQIVSGHFAGGAEVGVIFIEPKDMPGGS